MRLGIVQFATDRGIPPAAAAQAAEQRGFDSFYVPEHTHIPVRRSAAHPRTGDSSLPDDRYLRTLDPWVALGAAAALTTTISLGTAVALPVEHDPISMAKTLATLDHLSGGRVVLGVGFGWNTDELSDHGVPLGRRRTMLREYLAAMRALWTAEEASYTGEFVNFGPSWAWPKPVGQIPVLVGGAGTDKNLRWITRSADGWMTTPDEPDVAGRVVELRRLWTEAGRDGSPRIAVLAGRYHPEKVAEWRELGVTEVIFGLPEKGELGYLDKLAERLAPT